MAIVKRYANRNRSTGSIQGHKEGCQERSGKGTRGIEETVWRTSGYGRGSENGG